MFQDRNKEKEFEKEEFDTKIPDDLFSLAMANSFDAFMIAKAQKGLSLIHIWLSVCQSW